MTAKQSVIVKQLPERVSLQETRGLVQAMSFLKEDRPNLVFDFSGVRHLDSAGIEMLLGCLEEAMKRNGDLKLAAIPPEVSVILRLTRVDCFFEIFDKVSDAVESFHRYPLSAFQQIAENTYPGILADNSERRNPE